MIAAFTLIDGFEACAVVQANGSAGRVSLAEPFDIVPATSVPLAMTDEVARLAEIDPDHPLADEAASQTLSLFGREDLIATASKDYRPTHCAPLKPAPDVFGEIERRARRTAIVIVNESHERSEHRGFVANVTRRLRALGYRTLAIETLRNNPPTTPRQYAPTFLKQPDLPYFEDGDGFYVSEAGFGRLGRTAKLLGYRLLPYEFSAYDSAFDGATPDQRIAMREEGQARTLAAFVRDHPGEKLLIHVGYGHAAEVARADGATSMAARLKRKTGIDPLTISQTTCRGGGTTMRLSALPADEVAGSYDLLVDHPEARFVGGRPAWRQRAGDLSVPIPRALYPAAGWRVVEARPVGEPVASVPLDRVAIRHGETIALMLPPGRYRLRVIALTPTEPPQPKAAR